MILRCKNCGVSIDLPTAEMTYCKCQSVWALRNEVGGVARFISTVEKLVKKKWERKNVNDLGTEGGL